MKKLLSLLLSLMLIAACVPAVAEGHTGTALFPTDENGYPDLGGVTLSIWETWDTSMVDFCKDYNDLKIVQDLSNKFNVKFDFRMAPAGQESENFTLMIASSDLPDIIFDGGVANYYAGGTTMAYEDGLAYDYTEYITPENTPNYWAKVMEDPYLAKMALDDTGRNVKLGSRVSGSEESCTCMWGMMVRSDYLAATGLEKPETIEEWDNLLRTFKENGVKYPLILNKSGYWKSRNAFSCAWNIDARNFYITADGEVKYGPASDEYREYINTIATWYKDGLINPDFTTDTPSDTWAMMCNGEGGALVDHIYGYAANYYRIVEENDPSTALLAVQMPKLHKEDELNHVMVTNRTLENDKTITEKSEHKLEAIAFLDALYFDEIEFEMSNGIEGVGYNLNEFGYPVITDIEYSETATDDEKQSMRLYQWETESDSDLDYILTSKYCYGVQPECVKLYVQCGYDRYYNNSNVSFTAEEAEVRADHQTDIETYRDEMMTKFIIGEVDIMDDDTWNTYISTLDSMGLEELTKVYADAYARYLAR